MSANSVKKPPRSPTKRAKSTARGKQRGPKKFSRPHSRSSRNHKQAIYSPAPLGATNLVSTSHKAYKRLGPNPAKKPYKRSSRPIAARKLKEAGLPPPMLIKTSSAAYKTLQNKWYDKLAEDGFNDLERSTKPDGTTSLNAEYLKGSAIRGKAWCPESAQFYRLLQNYLTHHEFKRGEKMHKRMLTMLNDGHDYRAILKKCNQIYRIDRSLYWLYYYVQDLVAGMVAWNGTHAEGMLNPANQDSWANDALLSDLSGQAGIMEAPNGLKLDQGWWLENMADWWRNNGGE